jgi:hypothetical protein
MKHNIWTDPSIFFAAPLFIFSQQGHTCKIHKHSVMFKDKYNRMSCITLNVGDRNLCNVRNFEWRKPEQLLNTKKLFM